MVELHYYYQVLVALLVLRIEQAKTRFSFSFAVLKGEASGKP